MREPVCLRFAHIPVQVHMRRSSMLTIAFVAGVAVGDAGAQSAVPPMEIGVDVSGTVVPDRRGVQWGPRVVVNFDGRDSLQLTASLQRLSPWQGARRKTDLYLASYRRLLLSAGAVRLSATLGGGLERTVIVTPAITFGDPPITFPSSRGAEVLPVFTTGGVVDLRLGSRAAIVLESSFVLTDVIGGRFSGGLVVPLRPYAPEPGRLAPSVPWARLDAGDRAWVTTSDGREVDGEVIGRSAATLTLRTRSGMVAVSADVVRAIDTTDPIRDGTVIGAKIGALGALVPAVFATLLYCSLEENCGGGEVVWINGMLIGMGVGVGAATGALADSLREGRVPLYRRGGSAGVKLAPVIGAHRLGALAVIRW
jgi:hypothetical protein